MYKFNNDNGAVVCDICGKIISTGESSNNLIDVCQDCQKEPLVVDNFDRIAEYLTFDNENTFYWVQVIKRRKDNPGMHGDYISYGEFRFYSYQDLLKAKSELIKISRTHNARVVLWVNSRDIVELGIPIAQLTLEFIQSKQYKALPKVFEHACGKHRKKDSIHYYIVDVDSKDSTYLNMIMGLINKNAPKDFIFKGVLPTIHGYHIICTGFNLQQFIVDCNTCKLVVPDIHKDNPTVLFFNPQ